MYVHGDCTAVIRVFHESMHGNYPDGCKISMHVKYLLQTRMMHGIRLNHGYFIDFRRPPPDDGDAAPPHDHLVLVEDKWPILDRERGSIGQKKPYFD